jgi:hypothetical protein
MDTTKDAKRYSEEAKRRVYMRQLTRTMEAIRRSGYKLAILPVAALEEEGIMAGRSDGHQIGRLTRAVCKRRRMRQIADESRRINRRIH